MLSQQPKLTEVLKKHDKINQNFRFRNFQNYKILSQHEPLIKHKKTKFLVFGFHLFNLHEIFFSLLSAKPTIVKELQSVLG